MFSSHIVFGDLDNHSSLSTKERIDALERFWSICNLHRPDGVEESRFSFYTVDNDSLAAGLSGVPGFYDGLDVIRWALELQENLLDSGLSATLALNLVAVGRQIDWNTYRGYVDNTNLLYVADRFVDAMDQELRPRMVGDMLIVTSRLLELGKKLGEPIVVSTLRGGNVGFSSGVRTGGGLERYRLVDQSHAYKLLGETKAKWLTDRNVRAFSIPSGHPWRGK